MSSPADVDRHRKTFNNLKGPLIAYSLLFAGYIATKPGKYIWFSWHPVAMLIAFVALAANAALIKKIGGYDNTKTHGSMMFAATALGCFGWYVIYSNKEMYGKPHGVTPHSKIGFLAMILYISFGLAGMIFLNPDFGIQKTNKTIRFFHKWGGRAATAVAWFACVTGRNHFSSSLYPI
jgi:hypothetical protein